MKKILALIFISLIIPQITFASWWNPFTWNIFAVKKSPPKEQLIPLKQEPQQPLVTNSVATKTEAVLPTKSGTGAGNLTSGNKGIVPAGTIKSTLYTNNDFKFSFSYPSSWRIIDQSKLGTGGTLFLFNYPASQTILDAGSSPKGQNIIQVGIAPMSSFTDINDGNTTETTVAGQKAYVEKGNEVKFYSYTIAIPSSAGKYVRMTIYGDPANFSTLDDLIKTLTWLKPDPGSSTTVSSTNIPVIKELDPGSLSDCDYTLNHGSTIYPLQEKEKEAAARTYIEGRLGKAYVEHCVERYPAYDDYSRRRIGFVDKRLTRLLDYTGRNIQAKLSDFYVDLNADNSINTTWMTLTGLLPECFGNPSLCHPKISIDSAFGEAIKNNFPTTTVTILTDNSGGEWRRSWVFWSLPLHKSSMFVDMITGKGTFKNY